MSFKLVNEQPVYQGYHTVKIYGNNKLEYYYINLYVGNPPQKQSVIIDTGSDFTAFPCSTCPYKGCGTHMNPKFDVAKSTTVKKMTCSKFRHFFCRNCDHVKNQCLFSKMYAEGSGLKGEMYVDEIRFGEGEDNIEKDHHEGQHMNKPFKLAFGCTNKETGLFRTQKANGIMGLAMNSNTIFRTPNALDLMFRDHEDRTKSFSLCFGDDGGFMTLGGFNKHQHLEGEKPQTVRFLRRREYSILVHGVFVNGEKERTFLKIPEIFMLDTGTTWVYLPSTIYDNAMNHITNWCKEEKSRCKGLKESFHQNYCITVDTEKEKLEDYLNSYPPLHFDVGAKSEWIWFPTEYFTENFGAETPGKKVYCSVIEKSTNEFLLLGSQFMRHYDVYFHRDRTRVTFIRSNCNEKKEVKGIKDILDRKVNHD